MQSAIAHRAPFVASGSRASAASARRTVVVTVAATPEQQQAPWAIQRRSLAALLAAAPALLSSRSALALLPDDDDEELIQKARANRKTRLASEKAAEKAFTRAEGFTDRQLQKELVEVQVAVNSLARAGQQLADGQVGAAADILGGPWAGDFRRAAQELSASDAARASAARVLSSLSDLQASAQRGALRDAKQSYVALVTSLQGWASDAAVKSEIKGL